MIYILNNIQKYLFFWILAATFLGLGVVYLFGGYAFSPTICLLAALIMIYPSLVPLAFNKLGSSLKNYKIIIVSLVLNFIIAPGLAIGLGYLFLQNNPALWLGLILLAILPGGGMATTWALKSKADMPTTIGIILFNLAAAILVAPFVLSTTLNKLEGSLINSYIKENNCAMSNFSGGGLSCGLGDGGITPIKIIIPIIFIVIVPLILAFITQNMIKKAKGEEYFEKIKANFGKFSNVGLVVILFILMSLSNNSIIFSNPNMIFQSILPLVLFYVITLGIALIVYHNFFKNSAGKALVWGSYLRYITLALGLAISLIFQNSMLSLMTIIIILSYFIQIPSSFWLSGYLDKN